MNEALKWEGCSVNNNAHMREKWKLLSWINSFILFNIYQGRELSDPNKKEVGGCNLMVECCIVAVKVAGSSPVIHLEYILN